MSKINIDEDEDDGIYVIQLNNDEIQKCLDIIEETQPRLNKKEKKYLNYLDLNISNPIEPILFNYNHIKLLQMCINSLINQNTKLKRYIEKNE